MSKRKLKNIMSIPSAWRFSIDEDEFADTGSVYVYFAPKEEEMSFDEYYKMTNGGGIFPDFLDQFDVNPNWLIGSMVFAIEIAHAYSKDIDRAIEAFEKIGMKYDENFTIYD